MAIKLNQNGIQFNKIEVSGKNVEAVISHSPYYDLNGNIITDRYNGTIQEPIPFINAIDINWNGAVLVKNGVTIRTTGDLLQQLETIYEKFSNYAPLESIEAFTEQISNATSKAEQALSLAQSFEQVNADWNAEEGPSAILNKPIIPTSIYSLEDWNDFATQFWVNDRLRNFNSAYDIYYEQEQNNGRTPLSKEEWIDSLHGIDGVDGENGLSAYELAVQAGLTNLSENEWLQSLKAKDGWSAYEIAVDHGFTGSEAEWLEYIKGAKGDKGDSDYDIYKEIALENGEEILSKAEWLETLKGPKGDKGDQGDPGKDGNSVQIIAAFDTLQELYEEVEGKYYALGSAYLVNGYLYVYNDSGQTTEEQWRNVGPIKGPKGDQGERGKSNYEIYKDLKILAGEEYLSEEEWLNSLKGERGKSNYEIYKDLKILAGEEYLSEEEWLNSLKADNTYFAGNGISISEENVISLDVTNTWVTIN